MSRTRSVLPGVVAVLALLLLAGCTPMPQWYDDEVVVIVPVPDPPHPPHPPCPPSPPRPPRPEPTVDRTPPRSTPARPTTETQPTKTQDRDAPPARGPVRADRTTGGSSGTAGDGARTRTR